MNDKSFMNNISLIALMLTELIKEYIWWWGPVPPPPPRWLNSVRSAQKNTSGVAKWHWARHQSPLAQGGEVALLLRTERFVAPTEVQRTAVLVPWQPAARYTSTTRTRQRQSARKRQSVHAHLHMQRSFDQLNCHSLLRCCLLSCPR